MRKIETVNIKVNSLTPTTQTQKSEIATDRDSKEKFTSFFKEKIEAKKDNTDTTKTIEEIEEETEEESDLFLLMNLVDGRIMQELELEKNDDELGAQAIEISSVNNPLESESVLADLQEVTTQMMDKEGSIVDSFLTTNEVESFVESFVETLEQQGIDLDAIVEQLSNDSQSMDENQTALKELLVDLLPTADTEFDLSEKIFNPLKDNQETTLPKEPSMPKDSKLVPEIAEVFEQELPQLSEDQITVADSVLMNAEEKESLSASVDELTSMMPTENMNAYISESFNEQVEKTFIEVKQEDFVYELEMLVVEELNTSETQEKLTTAHIKLTPESLGEVELQIEMQDKDLVARLIVEQAETKEWIDQQVAQLKEQLLKQEIQVKDFQVVVHQDNLHDALRDQQENPFFKQKQKETAIRRQRGLKQADVSEVESAATKNSYHNGKGISIFV